MLHLPKDLILASSSPRRSQLLRQVGLPFHVMSAEVDEQYNGRQPEDFAMEISSVKAQTIAGTLDNAIVIAADTIVLLDKQILGKPKDADDAAQMLRMLSGRMHEVITGYTIYERPTDYSITDYEMTRVWFRELEEYEIKQYVASGSPLDKAGAYGIQDDFGAVFVRRIEGCYYNVVGLPLAKVYNDIKRCVANCSS